MAYFYFTRDLGEHRTLCLAPLTNRLLAAADQRPSDVSGYFLFERRVAGDLLTVKILARAHSEAAAFELRDMLGMK